MRGLERGGVQTLRAMFLSVLAGMAAAQGAEARQVPFADESAIIEEDQIRDSLAEQEKQRVGEEKKIQELADRIITLMQELDSRRIASSKSYRSADTAYLEEDGALLLPRDEVGDANTPYAHAKALLVEIEAIETRAIEATRGTDVPIDAEVRDMLSTYIAKLTELLQLEPKEKIDQAIWEDYQRQIPKSQH